MPSKNNSDATARPEPAALLTKLLSLQIPCDWQFCSYRLQSVEKVLAYFFNHVLSGNTLRMTAFEVERLEGRNISHGTLHHNFSKLEPVLLAQINSVLQTRQRTTYRRVAQDSSILSEHKLKINVLYDIDDGTCVSIKIAPKTVSDSKMECELVGEHRIISDAGYCYAKSINMHINQGHYLIYNCTLHNIAIYHPTEDIRIEETHIEKIIHGKSFIDFDVRCGMSSKSSRTKNNGCIFGHKLRLVGVKITEEHAQRRLDKIKKAAKKDKRELRAVTIALSEWIFLITNLPREEYSVMRLFNTYKARWSVERWFWRAKHILKFDELRSKKDQMKKLILLCKILIALLWEDERPTIVCSKESPRVLSDHNFWLLCKSVWTEELRKGVLPQVGWGATFDWLRYASASHAQSSTAMHLVNSGC